MKPKSKNNYKFFEEFFIKSKIQNLFTTMEKHKQKMCNSVLHKTVKFITFTQLVYFIFLLGTEGKVLKI